MSTTCYAVFAGYAAMVVAFSGPGQDRAWGVWAVAGYIAALLLSRRRGAARVAALAASAVGALAGPVIWLAWRAPPTPDVQVVARSAVLLLQHGTPYLPAGHLASPLAYDPYLPGMTVFGLPGAFYFATRAAAAAVGLSVLLAPAVAASPAALVQNTVLFPLGLTRVRTPAASPLPGHLLTTLGPAGRLAALSLLLAAGLAVAASLLIRPPADPPAAACRLAVALTLLFALSPATRFGYFSYPIGLLGWLAIGRAGLPATAPPTAAARAGPVSVPARPLA